jgi:protein associated with RNAse G/E
MSKIKIEYSDYQKLLDLAQLNTSESGEKSLDIIKSKYSIKSIINDIKVKLFAEMKKHTRDTPENILAHAKYKKFSSDTEKLLKDNADNSKTYDMLVKAIHEQELELQAET